MSKRTVGPSSGIPTKRHKKAPQFGAPSKDDDVDPLTSQLNAPSSIGAATRIIRPREVPTLATLCARVFVKNLEFLFQERQHDTQEWLRILPDSIIPRLFSMLSVAHPSRLSHPFISTYFLRGDPIVLSGDLPGVSISTVQGLSKVHPSLRELHLTALRTISDEAVAQLLPCFPVLEVLILRGSSKLGKKTVEAAAKTCHRLRKVNLNYTASPPSSIARLTSACLDIEVLKLAGTPNLTDLNFWELFLCHSDNPDPERRRPLTRLRSLKLRHTLITESSLKHIIRFCPSLSRLDISFTPIRQPKLFNLRPPELTLEKLSLTSTPLEANFLQKLGSLDVSRSVFMSLHTLHIGALGASPLPGVVTLPGSYTLSDEILESFNDILAECTALQNVSLVGNAKLGFRRGPESPLANFIRRVGRRCKVLNLAGIPRLRSSDLVGLLPLNKRDDATDITDHPDNDTSPLHSLVLNNTDVGDEASRYIASCTQLTTLELAWTKFGYDGLYEILDSCELLTKLDLTGCRGIKVGDRRQFFEKWKIDRQDGVGHGK